jgi:hypothetical protein
LHHQGISIIKYSFVKDDFYVFLRNTFQREEKFKGQSKALLEKIFLTKASSGYLNSLMEVLQDP